MKGKKTAKTKEVILFLFIVIIAIIIIVCYYSCIPL